MSSMVKQTRPALVTTAITAVICKIDSQVPISCAPTGIVRLNIHNKAQEMTVESQTEEAGGGQMGDLPTEEEQFVAIGANLDQVAHIC